MQRKEIGQVVLGTAAGLMALAWMGLLRFGRVSFAWFDPVIVLLLVFVALVMLTPDSPTKNKR